jgi:hypothetical protein
VEERSSLFICYLFRALSTFILLLGDRSATSDAVQYMYSWHRIFFRNNCAFSVYFIRLIKSRINGVLCAMSTGEMTLSLVEMKGTLKMTRRGM